MVGSPFLDHVIFIFYDNFSEVTAQDNENMKSFKEPRSCDHNDPPNDFTANYSSTMYYGTIPLYGMYPMMCLIMSPPQYTA